MKFSIASLIGIPASGKSTLAAVISKLSNSLNANVIVLSFDDLIEIDYGGISEGDYKRSREALFGRIETLVGRLMGETNVLEWPPLLDALRIPASAATVSATHPQTLIVLDDNMYYRSMRQRVRQICKNCKCQHFQIFVQSALSDAIARNKGRKSAVDASVIEKMFNDMEAPINARTISVEICNFDEEVFLRELRDRLETPEVLTEEMPARVPQDQSVVHAVDLMTRKEIGNVIREMDGRGNLREISSRLSEKRKEFMEELRSGKIELNDIESMRIAFRRFIEV